MKVPSLLIRGCGLLIVLLAALWAGPVAAGTCESTSPGNWNTPSTWDCGFVPDADDDVVIVENVTLTDSASAQSLLISDGATLTGYNPSSGSSTRTLSVSGNWTNNGLFVPNRQIVDLNAVGTSAAPVEQSINGDTTFFRLGLSGVHSTKRFGSSEITIEDLFEHSSGTMAGETSTFVFKDNAKIDGANVYYFHNVIIDGVNVSHQPTSAMRVSGNFTVNSGKNFTFNGSRTLRFDGSDSPQTITLNGAAKFNEIIVDPNAVVILPDLGNPHQIVAESVVNNGVLQQPGTATPTSNTQYIYIENAVGTVVYQGLDFVPASGSVGVTAVVAGNKAVCNDPNGGLYRNRCFGIVSDSATSASVTLYTTTGEDDITDDAFFQYAGAGAWTNQGACASPVNDGNPCTETVSLVAGINAFLIGSSVNPPTPVTLTGFSVTHADQANHLVWQTATEVNFAGFYVQRSENGGDFARVSDFLYAQGGPLSGASYAWTDTAVDAGPYTYRLEAVDFDQSVEFFEPTSVADNTAPSAGHVIYLPISLK